MKKILKRFFRYIFKGVPNYRVEVTVSNMNYSRCLEGKCGIITGGSRGIGLAIAKKCLDEGAKIIITGRNYEMLKKLQIEIGSENLNIFAHDVSNIKTHDDLIKYSEKVLGKNIDFLINNAGISLHEGMFLNVTEEDWDNQFNTNLKGSYFLTQSFVRNQNYSDNIGRNIIFISSERGLSGDFLPYGLTKASLNSLTKGLAKELIINNYRVNAICPGVTATEMTGYQEDNLFLDKVLGKRVILSEEIAEVVMFLLTNSSNSIAGQILTCNEGRI